MGETASLNRFYRHMLGFVKIHNYLSIASIGLYTPIGYVLVIECKQRNYRGSNLMSFADIWETNS